MQLLIDVWLPAMEHAAGAVCDDGDSSGSPPQQHSWWHRLLPSALSASQLQLLFSGQRALHAQHSAVLQSCSSPGSSSSGRLDGMLRLLCMLLDDDAARDEPSSSSLYAGSLVDAYATVLDIAPLAIQLTGRLFHRSSSYRSLVRRTAEAAIGKLSDDAKLPQLAQLPPSTALQTLLLLPVRRLPRLLRQLHALHAVLPVGKQRERLAAGMRRLASLAHSAAEMSGQLAKLVRASELASLAGGRAAELLLCDGRSYLYEQVVAVGAGKALEDQLAVLLTDSLLLLRQHGKAMRSHSRGGLTLWKVLPLQSLRVREWFIQAHRAEKEVSCYIAYDDGDVRGPNLATFVFQSLPAKRALLAEIEKAKAALMEW
eukprot:PLAT3271.5.p1 GENE.PLAT3271.5~~PLAT3271.5.p1  ORF type:complete len:371 (-),score=162.46 PLAT3271.5:97-1209(-)